MTFSDLEVAVSVSHRKHGFVRDNLPSVWTPAGGRAQTAYSAELAGAMLKEADVFFDRALALYLLRNRLRAMQAATWAGVTAYYSNYFLAQSFNRLHMTSVTHIPQGKVFQVVRSDPHQPIFEIRSRGDRQRHAEVWETYYEAVSRMAWPDASFVTDLAPVLPRLRYREQGYRERINYRPGDGFEEIYQNPSRYERWLEAELAAGGAGLEQISDAAYTDRMAAQRLDHLASLLRRLKASRADADVEATAWKQRGEIVKRYAADKADKQFCTSLLED